MLKLSTITAASALMLTAAVSTPTQAASVHLTPAFGSLAAPSHVADVQWRRGHRHGRSGRNAWIALGAIGLGAAIARGAYSAPYYGHGYHQSYGYYEPAPSYGYYAPAPSYGYVAPSAVDSEGWARCRAQFRSLRADGTYTTYDGRQVLCPYLG